MKKKLIIIIGILILLALSFILIIGNKSDSNTAKNTNIGKDDIAKIYFIIPFMKKNQMIYGKR